MPTHLLIGAGAGLVSATLFISAAASAPALILHLLYPLPLCLAGLGWGRSAVGLAALTATAVLVAVFGIATALGYALVVAIPIAILVHLILQSRPAGQPDGEGKPGVEWYPAGRLVGIAALIAGVPAGLMVLQLGPDATSYQASIDELILLIQGEPGSDNDVLTPELVESLRTFIGAFLPAGFAIGWLINMLFNLWLAGTIAKASGQALRPWPDLHGLEIPGVIVAVFAGALIASFVPGVIGLIATGFAGAMLFAYVLQGLAVIHVYTLGMQFRPLLLAGVYLGIVLFLWLAILVAILGLGEPMFGLRARKNAAGGRKDNN